MLLNWLIAASLLVMPLHDFHTTILNFTYIDDEKTFQIDLKVDTEHLEYTVNKAYDVVLKLGEADENPDANALLSKYIAKNIQCTMNGKKLDLSLDFKEVNFAETVLHLMPHCQKRKLKSISMHNVFMISDFPNQKNLVNFYYKGQSKSMLFDLDRQKDEVSF